MTQTLTFTVAARFTGHGSARFSVDSGPWMTGPDAYNLLTGWLGGHAVTAMLLDLHDQAEACQAAGAETGFANTTFEVPA